MPSLGFPPHSFAISDDGTTVTFSDASSGPWGSVPRNVA
jgi:hypothetical protein